MIEGRKPREPRVVTRCKVEFDRLDERVRAESEDLSRHGIFVRTDDVLPAGTVVELAITLPDDSEFHVISRVVHLLSPPAARALGRRTGMGLEFLDEHDSEGRRALVAYLEDLIEEVTPPPQEPPQTMRVVVADSSEPLLTRVQAALRKVGFEVDAFVNGAQAYSAALERAPDAFVAAAEMPVLDGWTLVKMVCGRPGLADVPVVLMSEDSSDITRLQAYRVGARDFLHKPFTDEELILRLRAIGVRHRSASGAMLHGHLAEISLATLLSLMEFERKSGILVVLRGGELARLFIAGGRLVKIEGGDGEAQSPVERVMHLLDWNTGNFEFTSCEVVGGDEIGMGTTALLMEHARVRDEQNNHA